MTHPDFAGLEGELAQRVTEDGLLAAQSVIRTCREQLPQNVTPQGGAFDGMVGPTCAWPAVRANLQHVLCVPYIKQADFFLSPGLGPTLTRCIYTLHRAALAQSVERLTRNEKVASSILAGGSGLNGIL